MLKVAVIGTAGRGEDFDRLHPFDFGRMCSTVNEILHDITKESYLVSGGAAWADHIAVNLFNLGVVEYLDLQLPAKWDIVKCQFVENVGVINDPGQISNHYHRKFSNKVGIDSLRELDLAMQRCFSSFKDGFFKRNSDVAKAQAVIALTFGKGSQLKDGGTANTFRQYLKNLKKNKNISFHVDLNDWTIHTPAKI